MSTDQIRQAIAVAFITYRTQHKLTQKQLAKLLGSNRSHIANIEAQRITPDLPLAITIHEVIGISIYELNKACVPQAQSLSV